VVVAKASDFSRELKESSMRQGARWMIVAAVAGSVWVVSVKLNEAAAQNRPGGGTSVAVVNLVQVFNTFNQTKVLNQKLAEHRDKLGQEAAKRKAEIDDKKDLRDACNVNSKEWFKADEEYRKKRFDFLAWEGLEKERVVTAHKNWIKLTYKAITDEVEKVAKAKGFQIVVTSEDLEDETEDTSILLRQIFNRKVVYADPAVDISVEVLRNLNASFEKAGGPQSVQFGN
jgi:Skp family chaperone for outer membrane proteins